MTDNQDNGLNLSKFIKSLNENSSKNAKILNEQLEAFKNTQAILKQQLSIQEKLKSFTVQLAENVLKTFTFDRSDNYQQQISSIQQTFLHDQFETYNQLFQQFTLRQANQIEKNKLILSIMKQDPYCISLELMKLQQNILKCDVQFNNYTKANISSNDILIVKQNINKFKENVYSFTDCYIQEYISKLCQQNKLPLDCANSQPLQIKQTEIQYAQSAPPFNNQQIDFNPKLISIYRFLQIKNSEKNMRYQIKLQLKLDQKNSNKYLFAVESQSNLKSQTRISQVFQELYFNNQMNKTNDIIEIDGEKILNYEFQIYLKDQTLYLQDMKNKANNSECKLHQNQDNCLQIKVYNIKQIIINEFQKV